MFWRRKKEPEKKPEKKPAKPAASESVTPSKPKSSEQRVLTAEGWKRLMMKQRASKK